jgi:hypothetical protein
VREAVKAHKVVHKSFFLEMASRVERVRKAELPPAFKAVSLQHDFFFFLIDSREFRRYISFRISAHFWTFWPRTWTSTWPSSWSENFEVRRSHRKRHCSISLSLPSFDTTKRAALSRNKS